jgi:hypothetical protein
MVLNYGPQRQLWLVALPQRSRNYTFYHFGRSLQKFKGLHRNLKQWV